MMHKTIQITNLSLSFDHKTCFEDINLQIYCGARIAIMGRNGCGKSSLLKIINQNLKPSSGTISIDADDVSIGYVPQLIENFEDLSGGQRFNKMLTQALKLNPNILLLDEPTNHLDRDNHRKLMRLLKEYEGTLIVVSHDKKVLNHCVDTLWHIDDGKICVFNGRYQDYLHEQKLKRSSIEQELVSLKQQTKDMHLALMKEQARAAKSNAKGKKNLEQQKWPRLIGKTKGYQAQETTGRKKTAIDNKKQDLVQQLSQLKLPEMIVPTFSLCAQDIRDQTVISISEGTLYYQESNIILENIYLSVFARDRIAIMGNNGSGKSSLIKGILGDSTIQRNEQTAGQTARQSSPWYIPKREDIGYLDQHYNTLKPNISVLETIEELVPNWTHIELRRHLKDFLFKSNEEVNALVNTLSGGEKTRLCLAQVAAKTSKLLILDEITNNLDLETKEHVVQVLRSYPGTLIVISHNDDFLEQINIKDRYQIKNKTVTHI